MTTFDVRECTTKSDIMFRDSYCRQVIHATMAGVESGHTFYAVGGDEPVEVVSVQASTSAGDNEGQYIIRCRSAGGDAPLPVMTIAPSGINLVAAEVQVTQGPLHALHGVSFSSNGSVLGTYQETGVTTSSLLLNDVHTGVAVDIMGTKVGSLVCLQVGTATVGIQTGYPSSSFTPTVLGVASSTWQPMSTVYALVRVDNSVATAELDSGGTLRFYPSTDLSSTFASSVGSTLSIGTVSFSYHV